MVREFISYLGSPRPAVSPLLSGRGKAGVWFFLLLTYMVLCGVVYAGMALYDLWAGGGEGTRSLGEVFFAGDSLQTLRLSAVERYVFGGLSVVVQPIAYGFMFRYALGVFDWRKVRVSLGLVLITAAYLLFWPAYQEVFEARIGVLAQQAIYYGCVGCMLAIIYVGIELRGMGTWRLGKYWDKDFPFFFYLSVVLTVLLSPMSCYAWWVLLAQGIVLGYAAVRLGFWHSVGLHAAMNVLVLFCMG